MKDFIIGLGTKVKTGVSSFIDSAKSFLVNNPTFTAAGVVLLIAALLDPNVAALLIAAAIITAITMFWVHAFTLLAQAAGGLDARLS
jgi:hypothetical protein